MVWRLRQLAGFAMTRLTRRETIAFAIGFAALWTRQEPARADGAGQRYMCVASDCGAYIYDPARGDPDAGIPPGTAFADLPDDWYCPVCGAGKIDFIPLG